MNQPYGSYGGLNDFNPQQQYYGSGFGSGNNPIGQSGNTINGDMFLSYLGNGNNNNVGSS
tara:strand:- start:486 stop:665 length:180 start_codon:yes stop_codon:yes gene_type:complete